MEHSREFYRIFRKYLYEYLMLLMLPILAMSLLFALFITEQKQQEVASHNDNFAHLVQQYFDNHFDSLYALHQSLSSQQMLGGYYPTGEDYYQVYHYQNILQGIKPMATFLENIIVVDQNCPYVISSNFTYTREEFFGRGYQFTLSEKELLAPRTHPLITHTSYDGIPYLALLLPFSGRELEERVAIYTIPYAHLQSVLALHFRPGSQIYFYDLEGHFFFQHGALFLQDFQLEDLTTGKAELERNGFLSTSVPSRSTLLHYAILTPEVDMFQEISQWVAVFFFLLSGVLLLGVSMALHMSRKISTPIHQIQQMTKGAQVECLPDPLISIHRGVTSMSQQLEAMTQEFDSAHHQRLYLATMQLLSGQISQIEEFRDLVPGELSFGHKYYTLAVCQCNQNLEKKQQLPSLFQEESQACGVAYTLYQLNAYDSDYLYVLLRHSNPLPQGGEIFQKLRGDLEIQLRTEITLGHSGANLYFNEVATSFRQAMLALDYQYIFGKGSVLDFHQMELQNQANPPPFDTKVFYSHLVGGTGCDHIGCLSAFYNALQQGQCSNLQLVKSSIFAIFHFLQETFPHPVAQYQLDHQPLQHRYETAEDFLNYLCLLSDYIHQGLQTDQVDDRHKQIQAYIQENFFRDSFSIQQVADEFQMSTSALSKYYKSVAGENISERVNQLKIQMAMDLLVESNFTINEIVLKIGYYNTSSFIRKFKDHTGTTPGKYRSIHKQEPGSSTSLPKGREPDNINHL